MLTAFHQTSRQLVTSRSQSRLGLTTSRLGHSSQRLGLAHLRLGSRSRPKRSRAHPCYHEIKCETDASFSTYFTLLH